MSTPKGYDYVLQRNIGWTDKEEKKAFFNKYFKDTEFVSQEKSEAVKNYRQELVGVIESDKKITVANILQRVKS